MVPWLQTLSAWVLATFGITIKDLALVVGAILTMLSLLVLGVYSGKPRYREEARLGWFVLLISFAVLAWGLYNRNPQT